MREIGTISLWNQISIFTRFYDIFEIQFVNSIFFIFEFELWYLDNKKLKFSKIQNYEFLLFKHIRYL